MEGGGEAKYNRYTRAHTQINQSLKVNFGALNEEH